VSVMSAKVKVVFVLAELPPNQGTRQRAREGLRA
jgi:hypothetical protein